MVGSIDHFEPSLMLWIRCLTLFALYRALPEVVALSFEASPLEWGLTMVVKPTVLKT